MGDLKTIIESVKGFKVTGIQAGLKKADKHDMALIVSDVDATAAAVFTTNRVKAAPVRVNMEHLKQSAQAMRAVVVNTVSANAGTGQLGMDNAYKMAQLTADAIDCKSEQVFVMSTGVIGSHLPMGKIKAGIKVGHAQLGDDWQSAALGIMTTDTRPKLASIKVDTAKGSYMIAGITKGSGMIAPNMATMLGVLVTDAKVAQADLQTALSTASKLSYNRIVVDGDTSTNDMVTLMANGASGVELGADELAQFQEALNTLTRYLAQQVVRDGEGATKFITVHIVGAEKEADAAKIAHTIAASPLVKTAFYGNDANWGRIVAAAGRAGIPFADEKVSMWIATGETLENDERGLCLFSNGAKADYSEDEATAIISEQSIYITLDLCSGSGEAIVWTCDLSHEYVSINADYRT